MSRSEPSTLLLDYTQDKVVLLDGEGTFTYVNDAAKRILGFEREELLGENAFEYVHPDEREEVQKAFRRVIESAPEFTADTATYRHRCRDGSWVWLESRMSNLTDSALSGYVVSSREVTDRVEAQRKKRETEGRLREIANTTDDVLWMFDADWSEVLFVNPAYERLFGRSIERLKRDPRSFLEWIHPEDVEAVREAMARLSNGTAVDIEYRVNPDTDYSRTVLVQGDPITVDGEVVRIVGFVRDVTDRRRRERQLAVMDNLLRHNLRNELNVILGYAEDILDNPEVEASEAIPVIRQASEDLLETADKQREIVNLLTRPVIPRTIDLVDTVGRAVETLGERHPDARIETDLPESLPVHALHEIEFAVIELVENAILHAEGRPVIEVAGRRDGDHVELGITDNCPPIPEYDHGVLVGNHDMNPINHSSGSGLWLVYWIVDLSDGDLRVQSGDGEGNTITVRLLGTTS